MGLMLQKITNTIITFQMHFIRAVVSISIERQEQRDPIK